MNNDSTIAGLDVHKKTITMAVLPRESEKITEVKTIENAPKTVEQMVERLRKTYGHVRFVYEAGPCGYQVQRQISSMGLTCDVVAPALTPQKPGDRVKTDRRDAEKLARFYRSGDLAIIHVPTREEEAARDLVRCREDALEDRLRARHRLSKFLLRQGRVFLEAGQWSLRHREWLAGQRFEWDSLTKTFEGLMRSVNEAEDRLELLASQIQELSQKEPYRTPVRYLECFRGIKTLTAMTILVEVMDFKRFERAPSLMGFTGMVSAEYSSAQKVRRYSITKAGNSHLRRVLVESAWHYRHSSVNAAAVRERRKNAPAGVLRIARKADSRLTKRYWRLVNRGKPHQVAAVAVARELCGFLWAMAQHFPPVFGGSPA